MRQRMLNDDDYEALMKEKDVKGVFTYLRDRTYYGEFLRQIDESDIHRSELESDLAGRKIKGIEKILHFLQGDDRTFVKTILMRVDIECLRILIRALSRGEELAPLAGLMIYSEQYTTVDFESLLKARNWDEFKDVLKGTEFYRLFEIYPNLDIDENLFDIEKSMERHYYDAITHNMEKLDQRQNAELIEIIRRSIDLLNLIWFYRGRKFYHLTRQELLAYYYRGGLKITPAVIERISGIEDMERLHEVMKSFTDYAFLFNHTKSLDLYMERRRERYLYYHYLKLIGGFSPGLSKVVAYIRLCDFELDDITSIIESKRYNMDIDETKKYLIRSMLENEGG